MYPFIFVIFTRSDRRNGGVNLSRLNRFYMSSGLQISGGLDGIMLGTSFSDHAPIFFNILDVKEKGDVHLRISKALIRDGTLRPSIENIWKQMEGDVVDKFANLLQESKVFFLSESKLRFQQYKQKEELMRDSRKALQRLQERDPTCQWVEGLLSKARVELLIVEQEHADVLYLNSASHWIRNGDKVTKEFFKCTKKKCGRIRIQALTDTNEGFVKNQKSYVTLIQLIMRSY